MLMNLKAGTEAMRAMIGKLYQLMDAGAHDPDESLKRAASQRVELFTPLVKAYCADFGYDLTGEAIQLLGGVGYCREFPVEQYARDVKIVSIWEGTRGIQAMDLVGRKLAMEGGKVFQDWLQETMAFADTHKDNPVFASDFDLLSRAARVTGDFAGRYVTHLKGGNPRLIALTSTRFLECFSETLMAQLMLEQGLVAKERLGEVSADSADGIFYRGKVETVHFFCRNILPNVFARHVSLQQEDTSALDIPEEAF